jgi:hypothetical protein
MITRNADCVIERCQVSGNVAAWFLLGAGALGLLIAETILVQVTYLAFGEFSSRWWLALLLLIPLIAMVILTVSSTLRAITACRSQSSVTRFIRLSAVSFAFGVLEVTVAILLFMLTFILLTPGAFQTIPVVHAG